MKSFRIAVCFSGQARYWKESADNIKMFFNYSQHHHHHFHNEIVPIEVDYFIHTWDTNTWRYPKTNHGKFFDEKVDNIEEIREFYNPICIEQETYNSKQYPRAWDPMFHSLTKSLMMKRNYELENNFEYDVVVKARLDVIYNPQQQIPFHLMTPGVNGLIPGMCYSGKPVFKFPYEFNYNAFDDVIFYGDSRTMDLVGDLFRSYRNIHNSEALTELAFGINPLPSLFYGPGTLLYEHMINSGIHPAAMNEPIDYVVYRSTAAVDHLDSITDFMEIRKRWADWY